MNTCLKNYVIALLVVLGGFICMAHPAYASIPDIEGYVRVAKTNTPVVGVWVKLTNTTSNDSQCGPGSYDQSRYAQTDITGKYTFVSWTTDNNAVGEGKSIDSDLDGKNDVIQYPTVDSCDPTGTAGSVFSCGRDPFVIEVVRPFNWTGNFDSFGTKVEDPCVFCLNNGSFTYTVPVDLYYHGGGGGGGGSTATPTPTVGSSTSTPTPLTTGSINLNPVPSLTVGGSAIPVGISSSPNVTSATFTVTNSATTPTAVSTCPTSGCSSGQFTFTDTPGFNAYIAGFTPGTATLTVTCTILGGGTCTGDSITVSVDNITAWWQTRGGDIITTGSILSTIPTSCVSPGCTNSLIIYPPGRTPGIAVVGASGTIDTSPGTISNPNAWNATSTYTGNSYSYDYFDNKAKCGTLLNLTSSSINSMSDITSLGAASLGGYYWVRYSGATPLVIHDLPLGNQKVVLFVKNQNLQIDGNITVTPGTGFFMTVVGSSPSGSPRNIIVNPAVSELNGLYFVDGKFITETGGTSTDAQLLVRGSVVAMSEIELKRSLSNNSNSPAELFEYAPDQLLLFPSCLGETNVQWKELAP
jgi:hypothetical protein